MRNELIFVLTMSFNAVASHEPSTPPARGQHPRSSYQSRRISDVSYMVDILKQQALAEVSAGKRCRIIKICLCVVLIIITIGAVITVLVLKYNPEKPE